MLPHGKAHELRRGTLHHFGMTPMPIARAYAVFDIREPMIIFHRHYHTIMPLFEMTTYTPICPSASQLMTVKRYAPSARYTEPSARRRLFSLFDY